MKCPTCRRGARGDSQTCPRCGTDLAVLLALEQEFQAALCRGRSLLRSGKPDAAEPLFRRAVRIHAGDAGAASGLITARLCRRDFRGALSGWLRLRSDRDRETPASG